MIMDAEVAELFTREQERIRQQIADDINPAIETNTLRPTWELMHSDDLNVIIPRAKELGWAENKVQVKRYVFGPDRYHYYIEPYEDCTCPNLLEYKDYE